MTRPVAILLMIFTLVTTTSVSAQAQPDIPQPYLYYYSQLIGGLIIEHPDGTDSRQIAADVIPPNLSGLAGPGWSPSGKYFAAYGVNYDTFRGSFTAPYLFDTKGKVVAGWLHNVMTPSMLQWSPHGEDLLLVEGIYSPDGLRDAFFWLIDVEHDQLLVDFGAHFGGYGFQQSEMEWDTNRRQIVFTYRTGLDTAPNYYRVTMYFDGTTLREPVPADEFTPINMNIEDTEDLYQGINTSPHGTYTAQGNMPAMLTDKRSGQRIALPRHTGATICRDYLWTENEDYMITFDGTLIAGGGCGSAVLGVTNRDGSLWRELGGCSWAHPPCADWLPPQVNINNLPKGVPKPVQLDPVQIENTTQVQYVIEPAKARVLNLLCDQDSTAVLRERTTNAVLYDLTNIPCPYDRYESISKIGIQMVVAEDAVHNLLATYGNWSVGVMIWQLVGDNYQPLLKLNTQGLTLEFTDHNERLRARNYNDWKVYSVADILASAPKLHE